MYVYAYNYSFNLRYIQISDRLSKSSIIIAYRHIAVLSQTNGFYW